MPRASTASVLHEDNDRVTLTGHERTFSPQDIIVSKTDTRGIMTYVNNVFMQISDYNEPELIGKPHNYIRHPYMPRCVFKLLWDTIKEGQEIFAYVMNRCANGDHYWVLAHVTPTLGPGGETIGYHSCRRSPRRDAIRFIQPLYAQLLAEENNHGGRNGVEAALKTLRETIAAQGVSYEKFILAL